jgi:hypothetical protein
LKKNIYFLGQITHGGGSSFGSGTGGSGFGTGASSGSNIWVNIFSPFL